MPLYTWVDKKKNETVEILRSFADYQDHPSEEEAKEKGWTADEYEAADWEKLIGGNVRVIKGDNWGPGKGNW